MAGFHIPGDPYFPNQGNGGWLGGEPEEDPKEVFEEEPEEDPNEEPEEDEEEESEDEEESEEEPEIFNPPYLARVPANRFDHIGPIPRWATMIEGWRHRQRQRAHYGDQRVYYDLTHGGPADKALQVMTLKITNIRDQSRETTNQVRELRATMDANISRTRDMEMDCYFRDQLIKDLISARAEAKAYQGRHSELEERVVAAERRLAELQGASTSSQAPSGTDHRK